MHHCPSWRARPGTLLLGVVNETGQVSILAKPLKVDQNFIDTAAERGRPESRFRFAGTCIETGCANWAGHCRFGASLMDHPPQVAEPPACGIRATCRWHAQHGPEVCLRCPAVVTDVAVERDGAAQMHPATTPEPDGG